MRGEDEEEVRREACSDGCVAASLSLHVLVQQILFERVWQHQLLVNSVQSGLAHLHSNRSSADVFQWKRFGCSARGKEKTKISNRDSNNKIERDNEVQ